MKKLCFFFSLTVFLMAGAVAPRAFGEISWDFTSPDQLRDWGGEGIEDSRIDRGIWQISGGEQVRLDFPPDLNIQARTNPYLRIRLRTYSPRLLQAFWVPQVRVRKLPSIAIQPYYDRNFHTYWIKLSKSPQWSGTIEQVGLAFGGRPGWIEIDFIAIGPFSLGTYLSDQWEEFWLPRTMNIATINSLHSPLLFNTPLISWSNRIALLIFIIGGIYYYRAKKTRKVKIATRAGLMILIIWLIYDIRETYSQYKMVEEIYQSYVKPPVGKKTFPALGNFYEFVEFCQKNLPSDIQYHFYRGWPFDCRLKHFLYPRRINCDASSNIIPGQEILYHVVYQNPLIHYDATSWRLRYTGPEGDFSISEPGRIIARFGPNSFIFREE